MLEHSGNNTKKKYLHDKLLEMIARIEYARSSANEIVCVIVLSGMGHNKRQQVITK